MTVQVNNTMDSIEDSNLERRKHWKDRIEYFAGIGDTSCSWTRESFESDLRELRSAVKQVDNRIGELEKSISGKRQQIRKRLESYDDASEAGLQSLESKSLADGGHATHGVNKVEVFGDDWPDSIDEDTLVGLHRKKAVFQEIKSTLRKVGVSKLEERAKGYKRDFVSGEVAETVQEDVIDRLEREYERLELQMENKVNTATADLESKVKVVNARLNQVEKNIGASVTDVDDSDIDLESESNQKSVTDKPQITKTDQDIAEYGLKDKKLDEQHKVLQRMAENEDLLELDAESIAGKTDVSEKELTEDNGILDQVEEEYGTRFGI